MKKPRIRPLAICIFRHQDKILVFEGHDQVKRETFYRPLGGGIEFGETSLDTVRREIWEEIGQEIRDLRYLYTLENIFILNSEPGHEIVLVYDGEFVDQVVYEKEEFQGFEDLDHPPFRALWKQISDFGPGKDILYPDGLLEKLKE
jgi:8-oxo-dGTP pyrophosphatase MutT (NUDIX family)